MITYIRMLEDRDGAPDHIHIETYRAGEVYSLQRHDPQISQDLLDGFVASGHAVEVDGSGNPIGTPASKRQTKPTGPAATKADMPPTDDETSAPPIHPALAARLYPVEDEPEVATEPAPEPPPAKPAK